MSNSVQSVAYFSAEYAIADDLPMYAGGLGILAADTVLEAGVQNRTFNAVGMVYHQSFTGDDPDQRTMVERLRANGFELAVGDNGERLVVRARVETRSVALQAWVKSWGNTRLILLDAHLDDNDERDRTISCHLYPGDLNLQMAQDICLGFGGVAMLEAMGVHPDIYHLNEAHAAFAGLALVLQAMQANPGLGFAEAVAEVKPRLVGTKHTILPGAGLHLSWPEVATMLEPTLNNQGASMNDLRPVATTTQGIFSGTRLLVSLTNIANGVSRIHIMSELREHPDSKLVDITNGIFCRRWAAPDWEANYRNYEDDKLWAVHSESRRQMLDHVRDQTGKIMDPERLTVVWARRMAEYKRPELLVSDVDRLGRLMRNADHPVQVVMAGRANPSDAKGIELMNQVIEAARRPDITESFAYLPHYNTVTAKFLVRGADLWLNTPIRGYEACGTSGMKASLNGALQFSTSDGWLDEVDIEAIGWRLPADQPEQAIYQILEDVIAPLFYKRTGGLPKFWIAKMRANTDLINDRFTTTRMLAEYYNKLYEPSLAARTLTA